MLFRSGRTPKRGINGNGSAQIQKRQNVAQSGVSRRSKNVADTQSKFGNGGDNYARNGTQPQTVSELRNGGRSQNVANANSAPRQQQRKRQVSKSDIERRSKMWPTPTATEHKYRLQGSSQASKNLNALHGGKLNPTWVEWLMGFPIGWTDLED